MCDISKPNDCIIERMKENCCPESIVVVNTISTEFFKFLNSQQSPHPFSLYSIMKLSSPSPASTTTSNPNSNPTAATITRSDPSNPYPTTFVQADTSSFKQIVQSLTGSKLNPIPPIKPSNNKSRPSTKLYERRNTSFNPLLPTPAGHPYSPRGPPTPDYNNINIPSPSSLNFPGLLLSPVTPLLLDPFTRSPVDMIAEEKAIADKGFFLHPVSPGSEPRLLPLFPLTSPKLS